MVNVTRGHPILAAGVDGQMAAFQSLLLFGAILLAVTLAVFVLLFVRRRIRSRAETERAEVLSLDQLRRLRDRGELTIAEFDTLREQSIAAMRQGISSESEANAR